MWPLAAHQVTLYALQFILLPFWLMRIFDQPQFWFFGSVFFGVAGVVLDVIEMQLVSFSALKRQQEKSDSVNMIQYYGWTRHRSILTTFRETPAKLGGLTEALEEGLVESLQSHCIHTRFHWSSGPPVCFPSWGTRVQSPGGYLSRYIGDPAVIDYCGLVWGGLRPEP